MENNKENRNYLQTRKVIGLKDYQIEMIEKQAADLGSESSELKADCITEKGQELPGVFLDDFGDARISLLPDSGCFRAQERMRRYLHRMDADRLLYHFRSASGLSVKEAEPLDGWDASESLLRGHTTGHFLSALALCFRICRDEELKAKAGYMVRSLKECQDSFWAGHRAAEGFLSGYSEEQFDLLEKYTPYPQIWAPYYTLHKLFAGLLDCYEYLQDEIALSISVRLADWVYRRLSRLSHSQRMKMWGLYIAGEFGGMNEVMAKLYRITGKEDYLSCARMFDNDKLFAPLLLGKDALGGLHANQHIPQVIGALEIFLVSGEKRYLIIARRFWEYVTTGHIYAPGGMGEREMFRDRGVIGGFLTANTQETCASYNMLKLTRTLWRLDPDARYMDYYERTMLNHILASQDQEETGESTYFLPLAPGSRKEYEWENSCCHGTGMESQFKYGETIYFHDGKGKVYVNLYLPSVLDDSRNHINIIQKADENEPGRIRIFVKGNIDILALRKPGWCEGGYRILVNGESHEGRANDRGYINLELSFSEGTELEIEFPFRLRYLKTPDMPRLAAIQAGPYILAAPGEQREFLKQPADEGQLNQIFEKDPEIFAYAWEEIRFFPLYRIREGAYHVYFDIG